MLLFAVRTGAYYKVRLKGVNTFLGSVKCMNFFTPQGLTWTKKCLKYRLVVAVDAATLS